MLLFALAGWIYQEQLKVIDYLKDENRTLRKLVKQGRIRLSVEDRRRLGVKGRAIGRKQLQEVATIACADTILRWFRELVARKWTFKRKSKGRPRTQAEIRELIVHLAKENTTWGYTRIQGTLKNLAIKVSRGTIANVLKENGLEGGPERGGNITWKTFLKAHWEVLAASDFLTTEVWTRNGLVTFFIFFVIELNAYAERFVLTLKSECLEKMVFFGERSLRRVISEFMDHYHHERNHQSLGNKVIIPSEHIGQKHGSIQRKQRLGGMLNYYYRVAA